jgi:MFS family permease
MKKHKEHLDRQKVKLIAFISFLLGFSQSVLIYVMSTYFKQASGTDNVGSFYLIAYVILFIALLNLHKGAKFFGKANVFFLAVFFKLIVIAFLANINPSWIGIFSLMLYVIFAGVEWVSLDAILESYSCDNESGRIRGKHLTIFNAGFLLGPFISTRILDRFDFSGIFIFLLVFNSAVFIYVLLKLRTSNDHFQPTISIRKMFRKIVKRRDIMNIYYISFVLEFFFALMIIYTPIYLLELGMDWEQIGNIFTFMLLPFVLLQYPVGILADKMKKEGQLIILALLIIFFSVTGVYLMGSISVIVWSLLLFGTRIGASLIEILRDSYFYRRIDGEDVDLINFFRTTLPLGYIVASILSFIAIQLFSVSAVFVLVALVVLSALYPAYNLTSRRLKG